MKKTSNYLLTIIEDTDTSSMTFEDFRKLICGFGEGSTSSPYSNVQLIDVALKVLDQKIANEATARNLAISSLVNSAPEALDTLKELSEALGNDANFASTVTKSLATKADASEVEELISSIKTIIDNINGVVS